MPQWLHIPEHAQQPSKGFVHVPHYPAFRHHVPNMLYQVFMTRRDLLKCVHEPFGDAWYFGPERLAERYANDEDTREASGFAKSTYQIIMERINQDNTEVRLSPVLS